MLAFSGIIITKYHNGIILEKRWENKNDQSIILINIKRVFFSFSVIRNVIKKMIFITGFKQLC